MSWLTENSVTLFQLLCIKVVKTGRVPQHIAFIMDGNRRFAKKKSQNTTGGHYRGFDKLSETLKWCLDLGIPELTVYGFSIENFNRSKEEVDDLMELAKNKFLRLLNDIEQLRDWGIRVHVAGRLSLLPDDLRILVSRAMLATRHHDKIRLNIAYAYTGRDEISRAASHLVNAVQSNKISAEDIDETLVSQTLELSEPQLLIRTSGEVRLSDFMLWQVSKTVLYFTEVLWPELSVWNLLAAIIHYRRYGPELKKAEQLSERKQEFLDNLEIQRWQDLEKLVCC